MRYALFALTLIAVPLSACATTPAPVNAIAKEQPYAGIIKQAGKLKTRSDTYAKTPSLTLLTNEKFQAFTAEVGSLSEQNLKAHLDMKARGTDNDLKCVLKGVSIDLKLKHDALIAAKTDAELQHTLNELSALLSDNIDVITTPATVQSGMDCVLEFGVSGT
ncbi:hypothetical protein [Asticcacaulis endophyticus]|uniref:Lipoprotein n=1 Tax=Asticcacaulis endophyticus TaxID=1395890 RepID=A0A918UQZ6_9CAUL|nr:hypothetical protein [Asticcacaulis endophyticus]GGZ27423.1 hypothetical protein GCM10011273_11390 [Asticcacaulis endophyticus]